MKASKKGSQAALFTDKDVRREYFASKQWVDQHVNLKVHRTGCAVVYEEAHPKRNPDKAPNPGRYQGSLFNQQKHAIANAVDWIRCNSKYKPRIFVATTPGFIDHQAEGKYIQKLVHNLRNGYGMENYVWVRELTQHGFPHWHFVADVGHVPAVDLSVYWSGLFGSDARNSIRFGTRPDKKGVRRYFVNSERMSWYLTKYLGKAIGDCEKRAKGQRSTFRTFAISQEARKSSEPLLYRSRTQLLWTGLRQREFQLQDDQIEEGVKMTENPRDFAWKWTGHGQTYVGVRKCKQAKR